MRKRELARRIVLANREIKSLEQRVIDLETELSDDMKTVKVRKLNGIYDLRNLEYVDEQRITLAGKVEKIIEHLGLDLEVKQKECIPAKITVRAKKERKK